MHVQLLLSLKLSQKAHGMEEKGNTVSTLPVFMQFTILSVNSMDLLFSRLSVHPQVIRLHMHCLSRFIMLKCFKGKMLETRDTLANYDDLQKKTLEAAQ